MQRTPALAVLCVALIMLLSGCTSTDSNNPPQIKGFEPGGDVTIPEDGSAPFAVSASDRDGQKLTCTWLVDGVRNVTQRPPFTFSYAPGRAVGEHQLNAVVSDGSLTALQSWRVIVYRINRPPAFAGVTPAEKDPSVNEGASLEFRASALDPEGDGVVLSWTLDGKNVPAAGGAYGFAPDYAMAGLHVIIVSASDGNMTSQHRWNVSVVNVNRAPLYVDWTPAQDPTVTELDTLHFNASAVDDDGDTVTYHWTLDGSTTVVGQAFDYTPDYRASGNHTVEVFAADGALETGHSWKVHVDNLNRPPAIVFSSPAGDVSTGEYEAVPFFMDYSDDDGDLIFIKWFLDNGTVAAAMGQRFNYTPGFNSTGAHTVKAQLSDGTAFLERTWNVTVSRKKADWTVLVYSNGDNDLEPYLLEDMNEMEMVGSTEHVNIVVQMDRTPSYDASNGDWATTRRYRIEKDADSRLIGSRLLLDMGEQNMGTEAALTDFLLWGLDNFPADRYQIVMEGHGDGWSGISQDFTDNHDRLTLEGVVNSVRGFNQARNAGAVEVLEFDVCYWAMLECDWALRDTARYIIGSEDIDPSPGQAYNTYLANLTLHPNMTASELAQAAVQAFGESYTDGKFWPEDNDTFTLSAIDSSKVALLAQKFDELSAWLLSDFNASKAAIQAARSSVLYFGKPDYIDLYHFVQLLRQASTSDALNTSADAVMAAVADAVPYMTNGVYRQDAHGISIYFPYYSYVYKPAYGDLNMSRLYSWDDLLVVYLNVTGRSAGRGDMPGGNPEKGEGAPISDGTSLSVMEPIRRRGRQHIWR